MQRSLAGHRPWGHRELVMTEVTEHACWIRVWFVGLEWFLMWTIFKVFIEFVAILFPFNFLKNFLFLFWVFSCKECGILAAWPIIHPGPPALEGEVLTTGPPGKSQVWPDSSKEGGAETPGPQSRPLRSGSKPSRAPLGVLRGPAGRGVWAGVLGRPSPRSVETSPEAERGLGPWELSLGFLAEATARQGRTQGHARPGSALRRFLALKSVSHLGPRLSYHTPRSSLQLPDPSCSKRGSVSLPPPHPLPALPSSYYWSHAALIFRNLASFLNSSTFFLKFFFNVDHF